MKKIAKEMLTIFVTVFLIVFIAFSILEIKQSNELVLLSERASYLTTTKHLKLKASKPLEKMIADAEQDGMCLVAISAFRTAEQQELMFNANEKGTTAFPGTSEHEKGIAVDLTACPMSDGVRNDSVERPELANDFETLPEYQWLVDNASVYNFEQSYTKENTQETGIVAESWHWRYVN